MGIMARQDFPDIRALQDGFDAAGRDARALVADLTHAVGEWRADARSWSVSECLDHLGTANEVYLRAMRPAAERALAHGRRRRGPARPGLIGGWFVRTLEPPVKPRSKMKAPQKIRPRSAPSLDDAAARFFAAHEEVRAFLDRFAEVDLNSVHFPNPFIPGVRFSLATGLHVLAAHERRHLWQAWRVRRAAEHAIQIREPPTRCVNV
jgi:hypothetical protein